MFSVKIVQNTIKMFAKDFGTRMNILTYQFCTSVNLYTLSHFYYFSFNHFQILRYHSKGNIGLKKNPEENPTNLAFFYCLQILLILDVIIYVYWFNCYILLYVTVRNFTCKSSKRIGIETQQVTTNMTETPQNI